MYSKILQLNLKDHAHDLANIQISPLEEVSLVMYSLLPLSKRRPAGLKHPELKLGPLPAHFVTSGFQNTSV